VLKWIFHSGAGRARFDDVAVRLEHLRHFLQGFRQGQREKIIGLTCMEQQELVRL